MFFPARVLQFIQIILFILSLDNTTLAEDNPWLLPSAEEPSSRRSIQEFQEDHRRKVKVLHNTELRLFERSQEQSPDYPATTLLTLVYAIVNLDEKVDITDVSLIAKEVGKSYSPTDVNGDGITDIFDVVQAARSVETDVIPHLIANLTSNDLGIYVDARDALVRLGKYAVPMLIEGLKNEYIAVQSAVAQALGQIQDPRAIVLYR